MKLADSWETEVPPVIPADFYNEVEESNEVNEVDEVKDGCGVCGGVDWQSCVLKEKGTSNRELHRLARKVRGAERSRGKPFSEPEYYGVFKLWEDASKPSLKAGRDYYMEFLAKLQCVKVPEGESLAAAFQRSQTTPPLAKLDYPRLQCLQPFARHCRELHKMANGQPITLAQEAHANLFKRDQRTVSNWIKALTSLGTLKLAVPHTIKKEAATYFFSE